MTLSIRPDLVRGNPPAGWNNHPQPPTTRPQADAAAPPWPGPRRRGRPIARSDRSLAARSRRTFVIAFYLLVATIVAVGIVNRIELGLQAPDSRTSLLLASLLDHDQLTRLRELLAASPFVSRSIQSITPKAGMGYALGVVGALLILAPLTYHLRKHQPVMRNLGSTAAWFHWHELVGVLGALSVLFHANFQLRGTGGLHEAASMIALVSVLVVTVSGIIASYRYRNRPKGRLFSVWIFLHFPLFLVAILATGIHVLAVAVL